LLYKNAGNGKLYETTMFSQRNCLNACERVFEKAFKAKEKRYKILQAKCKKLHYFEADIKLEQVEDMP
jgi:hypothetical protein